jgi:uncharacterized protein DUF1569
MKSLFDIEQARGMKTRLQRMQPTSERQWGRMTAPQALAHCCVGMEIALGDQNPPRMLIGRILGGAVKRMAIHNDKPMKRNSPTMRSMVIADERDLEHERQRLLGLIDRFAAAGPAGCTDHPHAFFGGLTPDEWAILMYKHLDHHLRQFGV